MKKLFLSSLLLALSFGVSAQSFSWGAKVNVGSPNLKIKDIQNLQNKQNSENIATENELKQKKSRYSNSKNSHAVLIGLDKITAKSSKITVNFVRKNESKIT